MQVLKQTEEQVTKALSAYDNEQVPAENPFLTEKIFNGVHAKTAVNRLPVLKLQPLYTGAILFFLLNVFTCIYLLSHDTGTKQKQHLVQQIQSDFQIENTTDWFEEN